MKLFLLSLPWLSSILVLCLIYIIIPNTIVHMRSALFAGIASGLIWQATQICFISFQVGVSKYNAIYGTFASVPIFMIWIFVSWVIVLAGALLNFACQHVSDFEVIDFKEELHFNAQEKICLSVLLLVCQEFDRNGTKLSASEISTRLKLPLSLVESSLKELEQIDAVVTVTLGERIYFIPAKPIDQIKITDFFMGMKLCDGHDFEIGDEKFSSSVNAIIEDMNSALNTKFGNEGIGPRLNNPPAQVSHE